MLDIAATLPITISQQLKKVLSMSAFQSSSEYASKGIALLDEHKWDERYRGLSLDLYSCGADARGFVGDVETMLSYCQEVINQKDIPLEDNFGYIIQPGLIVLQNGGILSKAIDLSLELLENFGCCFPKSAGSVMLRIVGNVIKMQTTMNSRTQEEAAQLRTMTDPIRLDLVRFLDKLTTYCYLSKNDLILLTIFRGLQWTLKKGVNPYSSVCLLEVDMHDAALANERCGQFHLEELSDEGRAAHYIKEAVKY